ncbi:hypothetical protein ABTZ59_36220 [Streptomyces sp. NPDC094034]|uniref:hypothetical protein n=1 Tax=Streptomyces sp. NPDC094034 TaxID=3155309 RepID=UPI003329E44D
MSEIASSTSVSSQSGLVSIRDFGTTDRPISITGEEETLFLPGNLYVSGQSDTDGEIVTQIHVGESRISGMRKILDEVMSFPSATISISDVVDPDEETFHLPRSGKWKVRVYVSGEPYADTVALVLDAAEWEAAGGPKL